MSLSIIQGNGLRNNDTITIRNVDVQAVGNFVDLGDTPNSYSNGDYLVSTVSGAEWSTLDLSSYATDEELAVQHDDLALDCTFSWW